MSELFDSLLLDCNNAVKVILSGNYLAWCGDMHQIAQSVIALKAEAQKQIKERDEEIASLKRFIKDMNGGAENGTD